MKKTLRKQAILLSFIAVLLSCISCKKNESILITPETPNLELGKIRNWVESQPGFVKYQKVSKGANSIEVRKIIEWENAKYFAGSKTYIIPVQVGFRNSTSTNYRYLVSSLDQSGDVKTANYVDVLTRDKKEKTPGELNISPDLVSLTSIPPSFTGAIIKYDINNRVISSNHYKKGILEENVLDLILLKPVNNARKGDSNNFEEEHCFIIDHWWVTYMNGEIVSIAYEGSTQVCSGGTSGGGGGNGPTTQEVADAAIANVFNSTVPSSLQLSEVTQQKTPETRTRIYSWKCLQGLGWYVVSREKGVHQRVNNEWTWVSLENQGISRVGNAIGLAINPTLNYANATVGIYNAGMQLGINLGVSVTILGITITNYQDFVSQIVYNINSPGI